MNAELEPNLSIYQHRWWGGESLDLPNAKAVCVGRNYAAHARELNNPVPTEPLLFIKPSSAMVEMEPQFSIPSNQGECHVETEITLLVGSRLRNVSVEEADAAIIGVGLGLDLTLRDLQSELKRNGHPWERAKSFDGALVLSAFVDRENCPSLDDLSLSLELNGRLQQSGSVAEMLWSPLALVAEISRSFTLEPGDLVLTGTPAGVTALRQGDQLGASLCNRWSARSEVL